MLQQKLLGMGQLQLLARLPEPGLPSNTAMPTEVNAFMQLFPQPDA